MLFGRHRYCIIPFGNIAHRKQPIDTGNSLINNLPRHRMHNNNLRPFHMRSLIGKVSVFIFYIDYQCSLSLRHRFDTVRQRDSVAIAAIDSNRTMSRNIQLHFIGCGKPQNDHCTITAGNRRHFKRSNRGHPLLIGR